jgi:hypothetical protein
MPPTPATRFGRFGYDFLYVAVASVGAIQLFQIVLEQHAIARFWETWVVKYPLAGMLVPLAAIALACGIIFGLAVGAIAGKRALRLAGWAAFVVCALHLLSAAVAGGILWALTNFMLVVPLFTGLGLLLGALLGRKLRRA